MPTALPADAMVKGTGERPSNRHWTLDRKVPLPLIVSLALLFIGQTGMVAWSLSNASTRLDMLERNVEASKPQAERIIRLEEKVGVVQQGINEIKVILSRPR